MSEVSDALADARALHDDLAEKLRTAETVSALLDKVEAVLELYGPIVAKIALKVAFPVLVPLL